MALNQQNANTCALHIYIISHPTFLHVSVHNRSLPGNQTKVIQHEIKLATFCTCTKVGNFVLYGITLVWLPDDGALLAETCTNIWCDIITI
jgi:hypothetical protein